MHGLALDEVAPLAPLLIPLAEIAGWWVVIGLSAAAIAVAGFLVWMLEQTVGRLPFVGGVVSSVSDALVQQFTYHLGRWNHSAHVRAGAALHSLARIGDWVGHEIEQHSRLLTVLASLAIGPANVAEIRLLINSLRHRQAQTNASVQSLERENHMQGKAIGRTAREAHIAHSTAVALPGHLTHEWDIPRLRLRTKTIEDKVTDAFKWIRVHPRSIITGAFVGAVAVALTRLRLGWLRCESLGRIGRTLGCGGFALIEDLMALGLEVLVVADICRIADAIETAAILVEPELDKLVGLSDFLCTAGGASYPSAILNSDRTGRGGNPSAIVAADLAA